MTKEEYELLPEEVKNLCSFLDVCMGGAENIVGLISMSNQVMPVYEAGLKRGLGETERLIELLNWCTERLWNQDPYYDTDDYPEGMKPFIKKWNEKS